MTAQELVRDELRSVDHAMFSIVAVDNDPALLAATTRLLRKEGYTVTGAENSEKACAVIREIQPDLVLLDVDLNENIDGRDLCALLSKETELENTFFVILTGSATAAEDTVRGLDGGADGYIIRPIDNRELLARVRSYLRIATGDRKLRETIECLQASEAKNRAYTAELKQFNKLAIGRELRMIELKREINQLCREIGKEPPYSNNL